jgi:hypothetical protein
MGHWPEGSCWSVSTLDAVCVLCWQVSEFEAVPTADLHRPLRCPLPDHLTPAHVHALLSDLRMSASQVGQLAARLIACLL